MNDLTLEQHKFIKEFGKYSRVYIIGRDGNTPKGELNVYGRADETRWNNAKPYQRFLGKIFRRYKNKFIDVKGFKVSYEKQT